MVDFLWLEIHFGYGCEREFQHTYRESNRDHPIRSPTFFLLGCNGKACWCGVKLRGSCRGLQLRLYVNSKLHSITLLKISNHAKPSYTVTISYEDLQILLKYFSVSIF